MALQSIPITCSCDPGIQQDAFLLASDSECLRGGCLSLCLFSIGVFLIFLLDIIVLILHHKWVDKHQHDTMAMNSRFSVKMFVLYVLGFGCMLRIVRYTMVAATIYSPADDISIEYARTLRILYVMPHFIPFTAYTLQVYLWLRAYALITRPSSNKKPVSVWKERKFLLLYTIVCIIISVGWVLVMLLETFNDTGFPMLNLYLVIVLMGFIVMFFTAGRRFARTIAGSVSANSGLLASFNRLQRFITWASWFYLVTIGLLILIPVISYELDNEMWWFLLKHYVYRIIEVFLLAVIVAVYQPPLKDILMRFKSITPQWASISAFYQGRKHVQSQEMDSTEKKENTETVDLP